MRMNAEQKDAKNTLSSLYISIAEGLECTDQVLEQIKLLEHVIHPGDNAYQLPIKWCSQSCSEEQCHDCAAIREGCTMDS